MILGEPIVLGGKGETASIFVTGLTETDDVTASKDGKTWQGVWGSHVIRTYYDSLIPVMTSNTTPSGTASASSILRSNRDVFHAFDGNTANADNSAWDSKTGTIPYGVGEWVQYNFGKNVIVSSVSMYNDSDYRSNARYEIYTSADGTTFVDSGQSIKCDKNSVRWYEVELNQEIECCAIKLLCTQLDTYDDGNYIQIDEIKVSGYETETVYGHLISKLNSYGTYTVTATGHGSQNVLVDMATEFDIEF